MGLGTDLQGFLLSMFVLIISLTVHELAHAKAAELAGDDTARRAGRISINPLDHLDPVGTIMMVMSSLSGFGIGWAKPVPVNRSKFRHPRWDDLKVSLWGPLSNLLLALVMAQVIRFAGAYLKSIDWAVVNAFVMINLVLALFNLIPVAPLDGSHILSALLPPEKARRYDDFMRHYGLLLLLGLVMAGPILHIHILSAIIEPPMRLLYRLFTGF